MARTKKIILHLKADTPIESVIRFLDKNLKERIKKMDVYTEGE